MHPVEKPQSQQLEEEAAQLEARLQDIRARLAASSYPNPPAPHHHETKIPWTMTGIGECN